MVKCITFPSGQIILGEIVTENSEVISIKNIVTLIPEPSEKGISYIPLPYLEYCKEWSTGVEFEIKKILAITTPVEEIYNMYSKMFGGIQIVKSFK